MSSKSMQRALRTAAALPIGPAILDTLKAERSALVAAAEARRPPVSAVSSLLLKKFGATEMKRALARQIVGLGVRGILHEAGFEVSHAGVRLKGDPIFSTGSVYRRRSDAAVAPDAADLFDRIVKSLNREEAKRVLLALRRHFPNLSVEDL